MKEQGIYFPIFINMAGKKVIIYGGGTIAFRRATALLLYGARVKLFAPAVSDGVKALKKQYPDSIRIYKRPYDGTIPEVDFVFSAIDDKQTDLAIYQACKEKGIPVNIASNRSMCDFYFPALVRWEDIVIGISSGGRDTKKAKLVAQKIREFVEGIRVI